MSETYKVTVDGTWTFELDAAAVENLDAIRATGRKEHVLREHVPYHAEIAAADLLRKEYRVVVNKTTYHVRIADVYVRVANVHVRIADEHPSVALVELYNAAGLPLNRGVRRKIEATFHLRAAAPDAPTPGT